MRLLLILDKGATTPYTLYGEKSLSPGRVLWRSCRLQAGTYSSLPHSSWVSSEMADATGLLSITVEVQGSTIILRGTVSSYAEKKAAEETAYSASGVTEVDNRIIVSLPV